MKKLLSVLLAVSMLLAMGSGMVLFGARAEIAKMEMPGLNSYTLDEANSFGAHADGGFPTFTQEDGKLIINITNAVNLGYNRVARFSTGDKYDQWRMNFLVGNKSIFGDVDLSNKLGIKFKVVDTGAAGTVPYKGNISLCFGSSRFQLALDWKDITQDASGYYTVDWSILGDAAHCFVGDWGDFDSYESIADTYYGIIDQVQFNFNGVVGESYSFYIDDFHAYGNADTLLLGETIQQALTIGAVEPSIVTAAEEVYKNTKSTQAQVDEQVEILSAALEEAVSGYDAAKETLNELLNDADELDYFNPDSPNYDAASAADYVYSSDESTLAEVREQIAIIRLLIAAETMDADLYSVFKKGINVWEYNYVKSTYNTLILAVDQAWEIYEDDPEGAAALIEEAYAGLVSANISVNTANFFEDWTTEDVNAVFEANPFNGENPNHVDSIGDGLNEDGVWNAGDFSNNTVFEADGNFSMTALTDFVDGSMGWKNMDRSATLSGTTNGAYPAMNVAGLSGSDGIRFKLEVDGDVERLLIGLSNCADMVREMYALKIKPEYVAEDGYINIPFSYFVEAHWCDAFAQEELEDVIVFIIEAYNVTSGSKVTISDITGYISLGAASASLKAKLAEAVDTLEAFDIDGRHANIIAAARALGDDDFDLDYENAYNEIQALIENYGIPEAAIIDVPGFSIYSQEELNQITGLFGQNVFTKTERGFKYTHGTGDWAFTNGVYINGTGYDSYNYDAMFGAHTAINGKTFVDMLGGYRLADIYAYRFIVDNPKAGKGMSIHYKDGVGLWNGMFTNLHTAYLGEDGYFTYYTDDVPVGANDGWYGEEANTYENILNNTNFICCEFFENENREIYGWQVILYEMLDRSSLREVLEAYAGLGIEGYDDAMDVYYDLEATEKSIADAVAALEAAAIPDAPVAPVAEEITDTKVVLQAGAKNIEYRLGEDGEWTSGCVFEGLEPNTEYNFYARIRANGIIPASEASKPLTVTTLKPAITGEAFIEGEAVYGETLTVSADMNAQEYVITWYVGDKVISDKREYTIEKDDIGATVYVVLTSDSYSGEVVSPETSVITKAIPAVTVYPDEASLFLGEPLGNVAITGSEVDVEGIWTWENPEIIPSYEQSGSAFTAVFTPADTDCYEIIFVDVIVNIETDTEYDTIYDEATGIYLSGEFALNKDVETAFGDILPGDSAYLAILRAARNSDADGNLILFKNLALNVDNAYIGTLELSAYVGEYRAGDSYTIWYFADGEVRSAEGFVEADGFLTVSGVIA